MSEFILILLGFVLGTVVAIMKPEFPVAVQAWIKKHVG